MDIFAQTAASLPEEFALVAIDGGGSKTECAVVNQDGIVLAVGIGGPSRLPYVSIDVAAASIREAVSSALSNIVLPAEIILAVCTHRIAESECLREVIGEFLQCPIVRGTEADAAFGAAGIFQKHGVAHIGGTGVTTWGFVDGEQRVMVGGWGMFIGDEGGGFDISVQGLRAAMHALDGRGSHTKLLDYAAEHFGFSKDRESILASLLRVSERHIIASFAAFVISAAVEFDPAAVEIVNNAIKEQSSCIITAARSIFEKHESFPLVLHGSVASNDVIADGINRSVSAEFDNVQVFLPMHCPSVGLALFTLNKMLETAGRE